MLRYFGVLNGTNLGVSGIHDESAVIPLESLAHARHVLYMANGGWRDTLRTDLQGNYSGDIPGGLGEGARITLYAVPNVNAPSVPPDAEPRDLWQVLMRDGDAGIYVEREFVVGPRGGIADRLW